MRTVDAIRIYTRLGVARLGRSRFGMARQGAAGHGWAWQGKENSVEVQITLTGRSGLVMHNGRLADSLDPIARELSALTDKHGRTDVEEEQVADVEWRGSLYWDAESGAYIPTANIVRSFRDAATAWKLGEAVYRSLSPLSEQVSLHHEGPKTIAALSAKPEYRWRTTVKIGRNRTARTRPIFRKWSVTAEFELDEMELSTEDLLRIVERAGRLHGIGDARKLGYGRFTAELKAA